MPFGPFFSLTGRAIPVSGGPAPFDPATLNFKLWGGNYDAVTPQWPGQASAGTSGTYVILDDGGTPPTGTVLGGRPCAVFNGSSQYLGKTAQRLNELVSIGAGTVAIACKPTANGPSGQPAYLTDLLFGDITPYFAIGYGNGAFQTAAYGNNSLSVFSWKEPPGGVAAALNNWHLVIVTWDGTWFKMSVDGGAWTTPIDFLGVSVIGYEYIFGVNYTASGYFTGLVAEPMAGAFGCDDATRDGLWSWAQAQSWWGL